MSFNVETSRTLTASLSAEAMGSDIGPYGVRRWRFAGDCTAPLEMRLAGRPDKLLVNLGIEPDKAHNGWMHVRCRQCEACLKARSHKWAARAVAELTASTRTWFGTLTVSPDNRVRALYQAQIKCSRVGSDWSELDDKRRFAELIAVLGPEVGKMLKRVRKNCGVSFRYLLVAESHKDGFPHFHLLLHEHEGKVSKRRLDEAWKLGFTKWRLVEDRGPQPAFYVCKYLAKSALARLRASQEYGQAGPRLAAQRLIGDVLTAREALAKVLEEKKDCQKEGPL